MSAGVGGLDTYRTQVAQLQREGETVMPNTVRSEEMQREPFPPAPF